MDREKVVNALECCIDGTLCAECCYEGINRCFDKVLPADALALLKEQEAEIEQLNRFVNGFSRDAMPVVRCKDCKYGQYCTDGEVTYQCFKWNSGEFGVLHEQDWFCADGKRKERT